MRIYRCILHNSKHNIRILKYDVRFTHFASDTLKIGDFHAYIVNNEKWYLQLVEHNISSIIYFNKNIGELMTTKY